jgi:hypothetical protein
LLLLMRLFSYHIELHYLEITTVKGTLHSIHYSQEIMREEISSARQRAIYYFQYSGRAPDALNPLGEAIIKICLAIAYSNT